MEYDPVLYQRDRGELDWDQRSMSSNVMTNFQSGPYADGRASPAPSKLMGYENYMANGPAQVEKLPLLYPTDSLPTLNRLESTSSLPGYGQPPVSNADPLAGMQYPPVSIIQSMNGDQYRQTPTQRPYTPHAQGTQYADMNRSTTNVGQGMYRPQMEGYQVPPPQGSYPTRTYTPQATPYPPQSRTFTPAPNDRRGRSATQGSYHYNT